jgi:hypothetical protein
MNLSQKINIEYELNAYARKGGKTSRRRQVARVRQFIKFCRDLGIREPGQIGKKHVWAWYDEQNLSPSTLRDRFYAVSLLWDLLGRGTPPKPTIPMGIAATTADSNCMSKGDGMCNGLQCCNNAHYGASTQSRCEMYAVHGARLP